MQGGAHRIWWPHRGRRDDPHKFGRFVRSSSRGRRLAPLVLGYGYGESEVSMGTRYIRSVLALTVAASAVAGWRAPAVSAQTGDRKMPVTAVGCLQSEREYRRNHESTKFAGTRIGLNDEYVLIDAVIGGPALNVEPITEAENTNCIAARGSGQAFELSGHGEDSLKGLIGHRVVIHGMLKNAKHDTGPVGTSGTFTPLPTNGGPGPGSDLELREINVESFSLVPVKAAVKDEPVIFGAVEPSPPAAVSEPAAQAPAPEPAPQQTAAAPSLPKTASPLPTIMLVGLLALLGAGALRLFNRQPF